MAELTKAPDPLLEQVVREFLRARGAGIVASDERWPSQSEFYHEMCAKYPDYAEGSSLINDAYRDARIALAAVRTALKDSANG